MDLFGGGAPAPPADGGGGLLGLVLPAANAAPASPVSPSGARKPPPSCFAVWRAVHGAEEPGQLKDVSRLLIEMVDCGVNDFFR